jgi:predicted phosphodiesterase
MPGVSCGRMRYLVFGDVHGNGPALTAVLRDARRQGFDAAVFVGDLVGYYPYPAEVVAMVRELAPVVAVRGNHDDLLVRLADGSDPRSAEEERTVVAVIQRHLADLDDGAQGYLRELRAHVHVDGFAAAHGGFRRPYDYVTTIVDAQQQLDHLPAPLALVGHTHLPKAHVSVEDGARRLWRSVDFVGPRSSYRVPPRASAFLNPGSVGQPRDGDPSAAYALFDPAARSFAVHRVSYDIGAVVRRIRSAGYPDALATRLLAA